jgi:hypothetical protein
MQQNHGDANLRSERYSYIALQHFLEENSNTASAPNIPFHSRWVPRQIVEADHAANHSPHAFWSIQHRENTNSRSPAQHDLVHHATQGMYSNRSAGANANSSPPPPHLSTYMIHKWLTASASAVAMGHTSIHPSRHRGETVSSKTPSCNIIEGERPYAGTSQRARQIGSGSSSGGRQKDGRKARVSH